jgi:hypothetical protein
LPNSTDANTIIAKGVNHKSPFAKEVFSLVFSPDDSGTATSYVKFDTDECREHFWVNSFATTSVTILNQERNNLAQFVRTAVECVLGFKATGTRGVDGSSFILAFLPSAMDAVTSPSPGNNHPHNAAPPHSPSLEPTPGAMTIVEVDSDSDEE